MNEIQLIRAQLATERLHLSTIAQACASSAAQAATVRAARLDYLLCVLGWFEARDQRLGELLRAPPGDLDEGTRRALEAALGQAGASGEALGRLRAAHSTAAWQACAHFIDTAWGARRDALDALLTTLARASDWRRIAGIDADSILQERRLFELATAASAAAPATVRC